MGAVRARGREYDSRCTASVATPQWRRWCMPRRQLGHHCSHPSQEANTGASRAGQAAGVPPRIGWHSSLSGLAAAGIHALDEGGGVQRTPGSFTPSSRNAGPRCLPNQLHGWPRRCSQRMAMSVVCDKVVASFTDYDPGRETSSGRRRPRPI